MAIDPIVISTPDPRGGPLVLSILLLLSLKAKQQILKSQHFLEWLESFKTSNLAIFSNRKHFTKSLKSSKTCKKASKLTILESPSQNRLIFPKSLVNSQIAFSNRLCFLNRSKQALLQATALNRSNRMFFAESLESPKTSNSILKSRHQNSNPAGPVHIFNSYG